MKGFRDRSIPLYYQLENILREKIKSGEFRAGDPFPTEEQLMQSYGVSRITVRQALASLEKEGLIIRKRGKGSFITEKPNKLEPMKLTGMIEDIIAMGIKTKTKIINFDFIYPSKKVFERLKLGPDQKVLRIERIRSIRGAPVSYSISYIPPDIGKQITMKDLSFHPILNIIENKCKIKISRGFQIIEAIVADARVASFLDVMTGAPLLKIERIVYDINERPVEYIIILYRSDRYCYSVELLRKESKTAHKWEHNM